MPTNILKLRTAARSAVISFALASAASLSLATAVQADETHAKELLKAMSDYLGSEDSISFSFDTDLEVVTSDLQKVTFASFGTAVLERPDKLHVTRRGGFADVEMFYDGATVTVHGKSLNVYMQAETTGSIGELVDWLRANHNVQAPGSDLLFENVYDQLMPHVTDVKDLGSGVIRGVECDHLAFRTEQVDWQIWIARGERPYPCRYVVTSRLMAQAPEYRLEISDWTTGETADPESFVFTNTTGAEEAAPEDLAGLDELPNLSATGEN